jgi:hypothetical protein
MTNNQRHILKMYHAASAAQLQAGISWYQSAHQECKRLVTLLPMVSKLSSSTNFPNAFYTIERTAGIVSALSPGLRWERNVEAAEALITEQSVVGIGVRYKANIRKAERIRDGCNVANEFAGRGRPKTRAFWILLCNPANPSTVCVDSHAYSIWRGERIPLDEIPHVRDGLYKRIAGDYIVVAKDLGLLPSQLQAITWVAYRHFHEIASF